MREHDLTDHVVQVDAASRARCAIGHQTLEPFDLGVHHRGQGVGAMGADPVVDEPLGGGDAGHGRVDLVEPGPVLPLPDLDRVQPSG